MFVIHRGAGMLVPGVGLLFALLANVLTFRIFGGSYYEEHRWPKFAVLVLSGLACLVFGRLINKKRERDAHREQQAINSLSQKHEIANTVAFSGPRDHLMFIPLQYWSIVYFAAALVYLLFSQFGSSPAGSRNQKLPSPSVVPLAVRREQSASERSLEMRHAARKVITMTTVSFQSSEFSLSVVPSVTDTAGF